MSMFAIGDQASFMSAKALLQQHVDHAHLGGGELAALDLGVAAVAAEEVVDDGEHQLRIEHEQRRCRAAE